MGSGAPMAGIGTEQSVAVAVVCSAGGAGLGPGGAAGGAAAGLSIGAGAVVTVALPPSADVPAAFACGVTSSFNSGLTFSSFPGRFLGQHTAVGRYAVRCAKDAVSTM